MQSRASTNETHFHSSSSNLAKLSSVYMNAKELNDAIDDTNFSVRTRNPVKNLTMKMKQRRVIFRVNASYMSAKALNDAIDDTNFPNLPALSCVRKDSSSTTNGTSSMSDASELEGANKFKQ